MTSPYLNSVILEDFQEQTRKALNEAHFALSVERDRICRRHLGKDWEVRRMQPDNFRAQLGDEANAVARIDDAMLSIKDALELKVKP